MHIITTTAHDTTVEQRPDGRQVREVWIEEDLVCSASPPIVAITIIDQPAGTPATISGTTITCMEVGRHLFRVDFHGGASAHLHVMSMERACLARLPSLNHGKIVNPSAEAKPPERSLTETVLILRAMANHAPGFDGSAASMSFDRVGGLAQYGA
jgi:hypothetical protein